jgi:DNA-binding MarR family transcriptional regulator
MEKQAKPSLGALIHDAARALRRRFDSSAAELGLSNAQWRLLVNLFRMDRPTQAQLAERLEVEPISVSRLVDRMAEQGWVTREADPCDRRSRIVVPTGRARAAFAKGKVLAETVYDEALAGLSAAERQAFCSALDLMIRNLSTSNPAEALATCVPPSRS